MSLLGQSDELLARVTHRVRESARFNPGRPAIALGVRTALATSVPLALAAYLSPTMSGWASTAGFMVAVVDKGGSYRTRGSVMGWATVASALAAFIGTLCSAHPVLAPVAMLACVFVAACFGVIGPGAASVGNTAAVMLCTSMGLPGADLSAATDRCLAVFAGGAWAMALALLFWPVRVYRPARFSVARCYRALASYVQVVHAPAHTLGTEIWLASVTQAHGPIRQTIEDARTVLAATRRGRRSESVRGALLLVLLQSLDLLFGSIIALEDVLDAAMARDQRSPQTRTAIDAALRRVEACLEDLAGRIETEERLDAPAVDWTLIGSELLTEGLSFADQAHRAHIAAVMMRLRDAIANAYDTTDRLFDARLAPAVQAPVASGTETAALPLWKRLGENLRTHPITVRHAARASIMAMIAVIVADQLHLARGYWVTLNVVVLLQPYTVLTAMKTLQRIAGTALGAIVAALILAQFPDARVLFVIAIALSAISVSVLQLNYGLYAFLTTPTFVLLAEVHALDARLPEIRIINTLIGGALALVGSRLFWPQRESELLQDTIADAFAALRTYFESAIRVLIKPSELTGLKAVEAWRDLGLTVNLAEASFQRRLSEIGTPAQGSLEPVMTLLLYLRRFAATCGALATAGAVESSVSADNLSILAAHVDTALADLETAAREGRFPPPVAAFAPIANVGSPTLAVRLSRLPQQLTILHDAMSRWNRYLHASGRR